MEIINITKDKIILGTSVLWLLPLLYNSFILQWYFLSFMLSSIIVISPIFWYNYKLNSIEHKLNNFLTLSCVTYVSMQKYYLYENLNSFIFNISLLLLNLIISEKYQLKYSFSLFAKILYRYYFYTLIFKLIFNVKSTSINIYFNDYSIIYFVHNLYSNIIYSNIKSYEIYKCFLMSSYQILVTIITYEIISKFNV